MTRHHILPALLFLSALFPAVTARAERSFLINDPSQFSCSGSQPSSDVFRSLIDGEKSTSWNSSSSHPSGEHYLEVDLGSPLDLAADEDLVVYMRRAGSTSEAPTTLRMEGSADGSAWTPFAHAYFVYRGPLTEEYSARIRTDEPYRYLRFTVTANNSRTYYGATEYRTMSMSEFNIIRLRRTDDYSPSRVDRFRLKTDYVRDFENYTFKYSQGFPEEHNRWVALTSWFDTVNKGKWNADGNWTADPEYWASSKIKMPSFTMLDSSTDPLIKEGKRQASHVTEHILYAVPGDAIALYPYYDLPSTTAYYERFSHWYDYTTGGDNPYLDFLIDPSLIAPVKGAGFVGGTDTHGYRPNTVYITDAASFNRFAERVNAGETGLNAVMINGFNFGKEQATMIGTAENPYRGTFDGRGNMLDGVNLDYPAEDAVGIFRYVAGDATIKNLQLSVTVNITGHSFVGLIGVYKDASADNTLTVENCSGDPNIYAHGINAAGILGSNWTAGAVIIRNCGFMGKLTCLGQGDTGTSEAGLISGWLGSNARTTVENCVARPKEDANAPTTGYDVPYGWANGNEMLYRSSENSAKGVNNYIAASQNPGSSQGTWVTTDDGYVISGDFIRRLGGGWVGHAWGYPRPCGFTQHGLRYYGTVATFFMPRDVYAPDGIMQTFPDGVEEYVIAADFAQHVADDKYYSDQQLYKHNFENGTIYEPIINSRHIFRIRDGKKFADDNMSTLEKNRAYIRANRRYVSARAGANFQIRFDSPVPKEGTTRSKWYYKISDTDYRRICSMDIHVYDATTEELISTDNSIFYPDMAFGGQGSREIDYVNYNACGGGGSYYRVLKCDSANAVAGKRYIVRLIAKDINGNIIKLPDGSGQDLWVQELHINFFSEDNASLLTSEQLEDDKYRRRRPAQLTERFGEPKDKIDYDEFNDLLDPKKVKDFRDYMMHFKNNPLDMPPGTTSYYFRWPLPHNDVTYSFGYDARYDYNNYTVSNSAWATIYNAASTERFDRLYYDTGGKQQGFFYYINAASDPGNMAYLKLDEFCAGSTLYVSAWVQEFSSAPEVANLAINFMAVMKDGERRPIHTFVTGYVPVTGKWYQAYYSFVPDITDIDTQQVEHYEIVLENNCTSSNGADYAIDDIRVYVVSPVVYANQITAVCRDSDAAAVKVNMPFETLLQSLGREENTDAASAEEIDLYYTFLDKDIYDAGAVENPEKAFYDAVVHFPYRGDDTRRDFGKITVRDCFLANPEYDPKDFTGSMAFRDNDGGERLITFNTRPSGQAVKTGKEFYIALYTPAEGVVIDPDRGPGYELFRIDDPCSKKCTLRIEASGVIKVDGSVVYPGDPVVVCENQAPVIQVDLQGQTAEGEDIEIVEHNAVFDWFDGPYEEFSNIVSEQGFTLHEALINMRTLNPREADIDHMKTDGVFTEEQREFVRSFVLPSGENGETAPRLHLSGRSYVFPPVRIPDGEEEGSAYVLAIPADYHIGDKWLICTQPTEVRITVRHQAPQMWHGVSEGIPYPESLIDVPLRAGLRQLRSVSAEAGASPQRMLEVPVRRIMPVTPEVTAMRPGSDRLIYLVESDDPAYRNIQGGTATQGPLLAAGQLDDIIADKSTPTLNMLKMNFFSDFAFREGYTYRFRYSFDEDAEAQGGAVCEGQDVFTVKVVPEYQYWTGGAGTNWNNDVNWRRASSADVLCAPASHADFLTDGGTNDRTRSFTPMDFTKVIIPASAVPHLFDTQDADVALPYGALPWSHLTETDAEKAPATELINFDMATADYPGVLRCRPWLANECAEIHFTPGAWILNQQYLRYSRAWADIEMKPERWYSLSSPFAGTVAGDMYMPAANARQESERFVPISFDRSLHDRFAPAVYQRSWNKSRAIVYERGGSDRNVFVETSWSNVFNDVNEAYRTGEGFSIKTDAGEVAAYDASRPVLMRLPKDDTSYSYYTDYDDFSGNTTAVRDAQLYRLNESAAPVQTVISAASAGRYFLTGNPYMAGLDMKRFFEVNQNIEAKYWIISEDTQSAAIFDPNLQEFVGTADGDGAVLAPMQGFFVEAKADAESLTLTFDNSMITAVPDKTVLRSRAADRTDGMLRISARTAYDGRLISSALVRTDVLASDAYDPAEDAAMLFDPTFDAEGQVYTVTSNRAVTVNTLTAASGTEVGFRSETDGREVTLRFEYDDTSAFGGLVLYDAADGTATPLSDGLEVRVKGDTSGRLFIMSGLASPDGAGISVTADGHAVTVTSGAADADLSIQVCDIAGRIVRTIDGAGASATFSMEEGSYIIRAYDTFAVAVAKIAIR